MKDLNTVKRNYGIVGSCEALDKALELALSVAPTDITMLITGENGVGKDVFSKIVHDNSKRKSKKFMAINCAALPEGTINSELFGHVEGAFTDAVTTREGYFSVCNGGTLFLDEIGDLPLSTQAMLLRVLENGEFIPVGSNNVEKTSVRLIAATNVDLAKAVREGKFREDLFYRIRGVGIKLPALRERGEDVLKLFKSFAVDFSDKYNRDVPPLLNKDAEKLLLGYSWPGNIRELRNLVEKLTITLPQGEKVTAEMLKSDLAENVGLPMAPKKTEDSYESERTVLFKIISQLSHEINDLKADVKDLRESLNIERKNVVTPSGQRALDVLPVSDIATMDAEVIEND